MESIIQIKLDYKRNPNESRKQLSDRERKGFISKVLIVFLLAFNSGCSVGWEMWYLPQFYNIYFIVEHPAEMTHGNIEAHGRETSPSCHY